MKVIGIVSATLILGMTGMPFAQAQETSEVETSPEEIIEGFNDFKLPEGTHIEIAPIQIPTGPNGVPGKLKTMAMDNRGNLLLGLSWNPDEESNKSLEEIAEILRNGFSEDLEALFEEAALGDIQRVFRGLKQSERNDVLLLLPDDLQNGLLDQGRGGRGRFGGGGPGSFGNSSGKSDYGIQLVSPGGEVLSTWPMRGGLHAEAIQGCEDGTVYVAGNGKLAQFDADGRLLNMVDTDEVYGGEPNTSGLCVSDQYVFVAFGMGNSLRATEDVYRFSRELAEPKKIIEEQYGCCTHLDLEVHGSELFVAENSRHRVKRFDFEGNELGRWGRRDRRNIEGFAACCNPCNTDIGPKGVIYTAESGVGRVKRFSPQGEFLDFVGYVDTTEFDGGSRLAAQSCYIPIEVNLDASRIYIMDVRAHIIRVLATRDENGK